MPICNKWQAFNRHSSFSANHIYMFRFSLLLFGWLIAFTTISATPQMPDQIVLNGDTVTLISWLPKGPIDADLLRQQKPESFSTACWDGYYRLWEIRNDSLFLNDFLPCNGNIDWACTVGDFYPDTQGKEVFASWVSEEVFVASDTLITWYDVYPVFAAETGFAVTAGIVGKASHYDNRKTRLPDQYALGQYIFDHLPWGTFPDTNRVMVISFLIDSLEQPTEIKVVRSNGPLYDSIAVSLLERLPPIPVYYFHGKPLQSRWNLPVWFYRERYRVLTNKEN